MKHWHRFALMLAVAFAAFATPGARAQFEDEDPFAEPDSAAVDSLAGGLAGLTGGAQGAAPSSARSGAATQTLSPKIEASVNSSLSSVQVRGSLDANPGAWVGTSGRVRYGRSITTYRQLDRDTETSEFSAALLETFGSATKLTVDFRRNTNYDENRIGESSVILDSENANARMLLQGGAKFTDGFEHHWVARGDFEDVQQSNRGVENNRSLAGAGLSSVWNHKREDLDVTARYGFERSTGERQVRGLDDNATAERDTMQARAQIDLIPRLDLQLRASRTSFTEQRLDFARNSSGVVDTASTVGPKVARERESTSGYNLELNASSQILPRLRLSGVAGTEYSETEYVFSRQGFITRGNDRLNADATFRYAEAGSLKVNYSFSDRYNDRRTQDDTAFRGLESARAFAADVGIKQKLLAKSTLELNAKQTLDQSIFEERGNLNDRDRLFERFDAKVKSQVVPYTTIDVGGTVSRTEDLQIAADRVGDNKEERLIEVRGSYIFDPPNGLRFTQTYRLQIRYIDFFASNNRDQFNKQGQLNTKIDYDLPLGGTFGGDYVLDFRRTGTRNVAVPYREVYIRDQRRFDHRVTARMGVPISGLKLDVRAERGFLREERGVRETVEDRGTLSSKLSGNRSFFRNRATLRLNVERILQFGPRIRDEQRDYWVADTTLTVVF